jgi:hypothetical protein
MCKPSSMLSFQQQSRLVGQVRACEYWSGSGEARVAAGSGETESLFDVCLRFGADYMYLWAKGPGHRMYRFNLLESRIRSVYLHAKAGVLS